MSSSPPTAPHFYGAYIAVAGIVLVLILTTRPALQEKWGSAIGRIRGWSIFVLVGIGLFGNGVYGNFMMQLIPIPAQPGLKKATQEAKQTFFSQKFMDAYAKQSKQPMTGSIDELRAALKIKLVPCTLENSPTCRNPKAKMLSLSYYSATNFFFHLVGWGGKARRQRYKWADESINAGNIQALFALALYPRIKGKTHKYRALQRSSRHHKYARPWILKELKKLQRKESTALWRKAIDNTIASMSKY